MTDKNTGSKNTMIKEELQDGRH